jgi:hypothetical protein
MKTNILRVMELNDPLAISNFYSTRTGSFEFRHKVLQLFIHSLFPMSQRAYEQISSLLENLVYVYLFDQMEVANWEYLSQKIAETQQLVRTLASAKV